MIQWKTERKKNGSRVTVRKMKRRKYNSGQAIRVEVEMKRKFAVHDLGVAKSVLEINLKRHTQNGANFKCHLVLNDAKANKSNS